MLECSYAREPFDLRLTSLRLLRKTYVIIIITLLGTLVFGGGYYLKNIVFGPAPLYEAKSTYYVEYGWDLEYDKDYAYINETSWNDWMHTDAFLELVSGNLPDNISMELPELSGYLSALLPSNLRMPTSVVTTPDAELSLAIARAVERSFIEFPALAKEIDSINVVDAAVEAGRVMTNARPARAFVLSGVLSLFFALVCFLLWETGSDGIWLPATLRRRYGLKTLGTVNSVEFKQNTRYIFNGMKDIAVCPVSVDIDPGPVAERLKKQAETGCRWIPVPSPMLTPEVCGKLRECDGLLLAVKAGEHGACLERTLEFLKEQDCRVTAALLWDADERLLRWYYFGRKREDGQV